MTTLTVLPVRTGRLDRRSGGAALCWAPAVGGLLGVAAGGLILLGKQIRLPDLLCGVLAVVGLTLVTRGLHLDGLADTVDGLGCYGDAERTLAVMRSSDVGPFGVAALVLALLLQSAGSAALVEGSWTSVLAAAGTMVATGRLAATWACRRGMQAARPEGLGALVVGTVPNVAAVVLTLCILALSVLAVPVRPWQGPVAVLTGLCAASLLVRHVARRINGITGDVLGAAIETSTTVSLVVLVVGRT